jgi:hypothetical protein
MRRSASRPPETVTPARDEDMIDADMEGDDAPAKRRPWGSDEDEHLRQLVEVYGIKSWAQIATQLNNRNGKQCRERWRNHLRPELNKGDWTTDEDVDIWERVQEMGTKWAQVRGLLFRASRSAGAAPTPPRRGLAAVGVRARASQISEQYMPQRTDNDIKNRWNSIIRKQQHPAGRECAAAARPTSGRACVDCARGSGATRLTAPPHLTRERSPSPSNASAPCPPVRSWSTDENEARAAILGTASRTQMARRTGGGGTGGERKRQRVMGTGVAAGAKPPKRGSSAADYPDSLGPAASSAHESATPGEDEAAEGEHDDSPNPQARKLFESPEAVVRNTPRMPTRRRTAYAPPPPPPPARSLAAATTSTRTTATPVRHLPRLAPPSHPPRTPLTRPFAPSAAL